MEIRKLNAMRGIAAMIVVVSHYSGRTNAFREALGFGAGQLGVMFFFILSGFLMSYLYMDKKFDKENVKYFAVARIARVMPLFVLIVLVSFLFQKLAIRGIFYDITDTNSLLEHLLLLSGISVLWTISPEVQFYVLFLPLWGLYARKKTYLFIVILITASYMIFLDFPRPRWELLGLVIRGSIFRSLPYFLMGVVFGRIYRAWKVPRYLRKDIFIVALPLVLLIYPKIFAFLTGQTHAMWTETWILFSVSAVFFAVIFFVPDNNLFLANPFGDFLGKISYSLYLLHVPILNLIIVPSKKFPEAFLFVFIAVSLAASYISYLIFESPSRKGIRSILLRRNG